MVCSLRRPRSFEVLPKILLLGLIGVSECLAQQASPTAKPGSASGNSQKIYVVLPFENGSGTSRLDWLSEGLEELTIQRLSAAREQVFSHAGRASDLERSGLTQTSHFSRATMLRVAEDLDADYVIYGRYLSNGTTLTLEIRALSMTPLALRPPLRESGPLNSLME